MDCNICYSLITDKPVKCYNSVTKYSTGECKSVVCTECFSYLIHWNILLAILVNIGTLIDHWVRWSDGRHRSRPV